ncbi:hypothetical protein D6783_04215 [Candidatus Woesearchaeota archaeon]|nr:MAG: hypothetical protein D6783_04215 [Candidatus Woesearchaeota archaeon]
MNSRIIFQATWLLVFSFLAFLLLFFILTIIEVLIIGRYVGLSAVFMIVLVLLIIAVVLYKEQSFVKAHYFRRELETRRGRRKRS